MKTYIPNNIKFRIVTSNAIARFKSCQAFDFNEVITEGNRFHESTREVLLLEYDFWFKFVIRLEKLFLTMGRNESPKVLKHSLGAGIGFMLDEIEEIIYGHPSIFDPNLANYISQYHDSFSPLIKDLILKDLDEENVCLAFPNIVNTMSSYLQQHVFILYEYDNIVLNKYEDAFLSFNQLTSDTIETFDRDPRKHPMRVRAEFFKEHFGINRFNIKNYSTRAAESVLKMLEKIGIAEVGSVMSMTKKSE